MQNTTSDTKKWSKNLFITFDEMDSGGVVYFANTLKIAHKFIESFIVDKGIPWNTWFNNPEWVVPIKTAHCNYTHPILAGKNALGTIFIKDSGFSSISFETQLQQDNRICAVASTLHIFIHPVNMKKQAIPETIKSKLFL